MFFSGLSWRNDELDYNKKADEDRVQCFFLFGKSRVVPLKAISVPRLELSAAAVSVRQNRIIKEELEMPLNCESAFWSDSMSVLRYVKKKSTPFHMFVANRVARKGNGNENGAGGALCTSFGPLVFAIGGVVHELSYTSHSTFPTGALPPSSCRDKRYELLLFLACT